MRILLVEDDDLLGEAVQAALRRDQHLVDWVRDGLAAERSLRQEPFDLLLLDLNLPGRSGLDILRKLRQAGNPLPVLILTARDTVPDRVEGLDAGADDYLVKPFDLGELLARVRAIARRRAGRADAAIRHGDVVLDPVGYTVTRCGEPVELHRRQFLLLKMLLENTGRVLPRAQLEQGIYDPGETIESNAVEVHVHHLRRKLGPELIQTVRGVGYVIQRPRP